MHLILLKLSGGTKRSLGRTNQIVTEVLKDPRAFPHLIAGLSHDDPVIRMRAADAIEKITLQLPALLRPFKKELLRLAAASGAASVQQEVRWHLALLLPRLKLTPTEHALAVDILFTYLHDRSIIVKTHALQSLADLVSLDSSLKRRLLPILDATAGTGSAAQRARARKLLRQFSR
jgi:HEAT repeat protein